MNKYTPGPWFAKEVQTSCGRCFKVGPVEVIEGSHGAIILYDDFTFLNPHSTGVAKANAALISAAPDLLDALLDMLSGWIYIREVHGDMYGVGWDRAQEKAEFAIKKSRGES